MILKINKIINKFKNKNDQKLLQQSTNNYIKLYCNKKLFHNNNVQPIKS